MTADPSFHIATSAGFVPVTVCARCGALTLHATHADHIARCPGHLARFAAAVKSATGQSAPLASGASMGTDGAPAPMEPGAGTTDTKEQQP